MKASKDLELRGGVEWGACTCVVTLKAPLVVSLVVAIIFVSLLHPGLRKVYPKPLSP